MPIHDWTKVDAGIFHAFHVSWIGELSGALNQGLLPEDYYALPEQFTGPFGPDVLTLSTKSRLDTVGTATMPRPKATVMASADAFYRRKNRSIAIRHISDDEIVAVIEIVSSGNKRGKAAFEKLIEKALDFLQSKIHLMLIDLYPASRRDPNGIHGAIWERISDEDYTRPAEKKLTAVAYESAARVSAFVEPLAVHDSLPDMPLFLNPGRHVLVPLESTSKTAFAKLPKYWQEKIETC